MCYNWNNNHKTVNCQQSGEKKRENHKKNVKKLEKSYQKKMCNNCDSVNCIENGPPITPHRQ